MKILTLSLVFTLLLMPMFTYQIPTVRATRPLSVGDWWSLEGRMKFTYAGTGAAAGLLVENDTNLIKEIVTDANAQTITVFEHIQTAFTCLASGNWGCYSKQGTYSNDRDYTIALSDLVVTHYSVNGNSSNWGVGHQS